MSTLSGVPTKGEKGKKFQSLDINSLYHTNRGESSDHHSQKNIVRANRHGMQPLGKVPSRRPPANLPSLKSEHSGNDPTVSLVPTGGTGWGSKPGETGPSPSSLQPNSQTAPTQTNLISQPHGTNAPAAAGNSAQPSNLSTQASTTQPPVALKPASAMSTGDKTWSSVTGGADQGPSFLAHQSPQFQQEFPSLSGEGAAQGLPRGSGTSADSSYGPGPSLRPQSEGSWILGGSTRSTTPQHPYFPQESGGIRNNMGQYGVGGGQGGLSISPPHSQISSMPFKPMPPFLVQHKTGPSSFPTGFSGINPTRSSNSSSSENRFLGGGTRPPVGEEVDPIPIVKVEDINRIDEISRDTGWANQNVIDYNETLQFSDNESNDEVKEKSTTKSISPQKNYEKDTDHEKQNEKIHQNEKPWTPRTSHHDYHSARTGDQLTRHEKEIDSEMQAKRSLKEKIAVFADKAHQRKEEEEQRFNLKKTMQENELKNKKDDYYSEKDDKPNKTGKESDFRQQSQMDSRPNYRGDRDREVKTRDSNYSVPPRFLKQQNEKNNQYMRQQSNDYFPNYNSPFEESRWQNHYKGRNDEERDKDRMKDKEDMKDREQDRERYNRGNRNDRGNEPNRKSYFDNHGPDYRSQRNFEDRKESEYRQREREVEWEGRRGNSTWHHPDDKNKRNVKKLNDGYSNKGHSNFMDDREPDLRDRPQRPDSRDSRERPEHPSRPDSRDSRVSRDSRNSRESTRDEPRSFNELSDYGWDDKLRKKDYKEERENQTRREGFGPIKSEKFTAYNEKKEKSSTPSILTRNSIEDPRSKTNTTTINSWGDPNDDSQVQKTPSPPTEQPSQDDQEIKEIDKKKDSGPVKESKNVRGGTSRGRGARQGGNLSGNNYSSFPSRGNWPRDPRKANKPQKGQWNGSESEQSADEVSASTESGKEDKKIIERKQRSSRSGDRKKEKDDRNRESKKSDEKTMNRLEKKPSMQQAPIGSGSNYESNRRKEGFAPVGEPSRRGRGGAGFRSSRGGGTMNVSGLYGPPGTKSPFPSHQHSENKNDDDKSNDKTHENDSQDEKGKHKSGASGITGFSRQNKDLRKDDGKNQKNKNKGKGSGEDWETQSDESGDKKHFKHPGKGERKPQSRPMGDKSRGGPSNALQINGRPSRSDEGKGEDQNVEKKQALDKDSDSITNNGFQEVKSKKVGKEPRPMSKDDQKPRGNKETKKPLGGPNNASKTLPQTKQTHQKREWSNKPPRMQRLENSRQQQQQDVNDMNKMNQNPLFSLNREVNCTAAPPPPTNAWDKPIMLNRPMSPPNIHLSNDKSGLDDHPGSQTGSPTTDKALNKMSRDAVDKNMRHTVQTIIIQNTNYKGQTLEKSKVKLDEDIDANHQMRLVSGYKEMKPNDKQESLQMPMAFSKNEDSADMDFKFDSELSQLTEDKTTNIPHSILAQSSSAADLNQKIASVKKVWDVPGNVMEHHDENLGVVSTASSTFTANFSGVVDTTLDHSSAHQVDEGFNNADVYGSAPMQAPAGGYSNSANIMKQDAINPASTPQPQQVAIASGLNHSASLSSPPPQYNQTTHFNSYQQYGGISAVPSPPTMISLGGGQPNELYPYLNVMGSQATRTNFNQYSFGLNPTNVVSQTSGFGQQSLFHISQPAGTNGPHVNDVFNPFRITPAPYPQSPQIPNNPTTVLITSSTANSSLMSATVKSTTHGAIGSKTYQSPHQVLNYMPYAEPQMIPPNYLRGTVPPMATTPTSFYSNSTVGQTPGLFQPPGSSLLTATTNQTALQGTFGVPGFNAQSGNNSSSNLSQTNYNSQPGHFRGQATASYLKSVQTVQHPNDPSKLVSSNQDVLGNSVFSGNGSTGQIPSPKSRVGGNTGNKHVPPQQPSPTQTNQKFLNYPPTQNLVQLQGNAGQRANQANMYMRPPNTSMLGNNNMTKQYNQPIQRPNFPMNSSQQQLMQQQQQQQQNRQQHRIPNSRQPQQPQQHNKMITHHYFHQQGNSGKIEADSKVDTEKLQETNAAPKQEKKEEATSAEQ